MSNPKEPRQFKLLHQQILAHPNYANLSNGTRFAYEFGVLGGFSYQTREDKCWSRKIWRHLYLGDILEEEEQEIEEDSIQHE